MRAWITAAGVLALAAAASAETLKVPQQYETIQEAVNDSADGDTIVVSKGVYYEAVSVATPNLKIIGKKAIIDGSFFGLALSTEAASFYNCMTIYTEGVTVQGFTFRNGANHVLIYANNCSVLKCVSRNAGGYGIYVGGYSGSTISGNRVVGSGGIGIYVQGSGAGSGLVSSNAVLQGNNHGIQVVGNDAAVDRNSVDGVLSHGIYVSGSNAVVTGNRTTDTGADGIQVQGAGADVVGNRVTWVSGNTGIYVNGGSSIVQGNTVNIAYDDFIVYGSGNQVLSNRALGALGGAGLYIGGDNITVTGNIAQHVVEYGSGFYIYSYSGVGGGLLAANRAEDASQAGFVLTVYNMPVAGCAAIRCGDRGDYAGFFIYGSGSTFEDCVAQDCHGNGFYMNATGNTFIDCTAKDPTINGFQIYGAGNTFVECTATGSGGQGFNNQAANTTLQGGTYKGNRIDITNEGAGTFTAPLDGVDFETGGALSPVVVVWYD